MTVRICKDCEYFREIASIAFPQPFCMRPTGNFDLVYGGQIRLAQECWRERIDGDGKCGAAGEYWQEAPRATITPVHFVDTTPPPWWKFWA